MTSARAASHRSAIIVVLLVCLLLPAPAAAQQSPRLNGPLDHLTQAHAGRSRRVSSAAPEAWSNADNRWIKPGQRHVVADIEGCGVITHIWLTFAEARPGWLAADGAANPSEVVLRMYWDGAEQPAVESPLGDFFAAGFGRRFEVRSLPVQVQEGDAYNCFWPMPFHKRARITLTNESEKPLAALYYHVDYVELDALPPDTAYFCAQYRQEFPQQTGRDYLVADIEGRGHYVGTVYSIRSRSPEWFGEGDDKFYVDGEQRPSIWGTGTEDYLLGAWGLTRCSFPCFGVPFIEGAWGDIGWQVCAYRWHIADPVRFQKSLRFEIEHTGWMSADETESGKVEGHVEREDDLATVAFWYQVGQPKRFAELPPAAARVFPNLDLVIDGKSLLETARHSGGELTLQRGWEWTGDGQLFFIPAQSAIRAPAAAEGGTGDGADSRDSAAAGVWLECDFAVEQEQPRRLVLRLTHSYDYGKFRILLDGKLLRDSLDLYSERIEVHDHSLGDVNLSPGRHTLRLECIGQHALSTGQRLGVDSVRLRERWNKKRPALAPPR